MFRKLAPVRRFKQWRIGKVAASDGNSHSKDISNTEEIQNEAHFDKGNLIIADLPRDVLIHIAKFIPKDDSLVAFMLTCKAFYNTLLERLPWEHNRLCIHDHVLPPILLQALVSLSKSRRTLTCVDFSGNVSVTDHLLEYLGKNFPLITALNISGCQQVSDTGLTKFAMDLKRLTSLDVSYTFNITCISLRKIFTKYKYTMKKLNLSQALGILEKVDVGSAENISDMTTLPGMCINLEHLVYRWDQSMGHDHRVYNLSLSYLTQCCTHLKSLEISGCNLESNLTQGLRSSLKAMEITSLTLNNDGLSDSSLVAILSGVSVLERLDISHSHRLSAYGLRRLNFLPHIQNLKEFIADHCYNIDNSVIRAIFKLPALRHLAVAYCHWVDDDSLQMATECPNLCYLDISGTSVTKNMLQVLQKSADKEGYKCLVIKAEDCPYNTSQVQHFKEVSLPNLDELHHVVPLAIPDDAQDDSE